MTWSLGFRWLTVKLITDSSLTSASSVPLSSLLCALRVAICFHLVVSCEHYTCSSIWRPLCLECKEHTSQALNELNGSWSFERVLDFFLLFLVMELQPGVSGFRLSNQPILLVCPLQASLEVLLLDMLIDLNETYFISLLGFQDY